MKKDTKILSGLKYGGVELDYAFKRNRVWKICEDDFKKILFDCILNQVSFEICAFVDVWVMMNSFILYAKKSNYCNYVIWRYCGTAKFQPG